MSFDIDLISIFVGILIGIALMILIDDIILYVYKRFRFSEKYFERIDEIQDYKRYQELKQKFESEEDLND